jgi:phytanoyl-CoA hydroxylase
MNSVTTDNALLQNFEADGYVAFPQFVTGAELAELSTNLDRFIKDVVPTMPPEQVFYEDKHIPATLKQIQQMGEHDTWFHDLFTAGHFRGVAEFFLHGPVVPKNMQYFNKPPAVSQPTPPHQDGFYFILDPCEAVTMWFALDAVDEENGCVRYIPGSHKQNMREHARTQTLGFSQGITDYPTDDDRNSEIAVPANPGDLLVHHALTIHRADANRSMTRTRRALGFIYYSERAREDMAARAKYQRALADGMRATGKI